MKQRIILILLALSFVLLGVRGAVAQQMGISGSVSPLFIEQTRNVDGYSLIDVGRAVNVTCTDGRRIAIIEQTSYRVMLGCVALPTATPIATSTPAVTPTCEATPTPLATQMSPLPTPTPASPLPTPTAILPTVTPTPTPTVIVATATPIVSPLVAYWHLDEASGTRMDSQGTNHLTDNNTVPSATGKVGLAANFVASAHEYLSIADNKELSVGDTDYTVAGWVYFDSLTGYSFPFAKDNGGSREYGLYFDPFCKCLKFYAFSGAVMSEVTAGALGTPALNTWYFVVVWHDSTANTINIQVNDGAVSSAVHSGGINDAEAPFTLGAGTGNLYHSGRVDEIGVWRSVLSAGQRSGLYASGIGQ